MSDGVLGAAWVGIFALAFAGVMALHRVGLPRTYARDLLHVGAGIWVLGWPWWKAPLVPLLVAWGTFAVVLAVPFVAARSGLVRRAHDSVAGEGERWSGIVAYAASFAALTTLALAFHQGVPAACAAAALCAGDGLGGLIGRKFGRHRFQVPWSKTKTWEGTAAVAVFAALGIALVLSLQHVPVLWGKVILLGTIAAAAEALAPRASDNLVVPAAVFVAGLLIA